MSIPLSYQGYISPRTPTRLSLATLNISIIENNKQSIISISSTTPQRTNTSGQVSAQLKFTMTRNTMPSSRTHASRDRSATLTSRTVGLTVMLIRGDTERSSRYRRVDDESVPSSAYQSSDLPRSTNTLLTGSTLDRSTDRFGAGSSLYGDSTSRSGLGRRSSSRRDDSILIPLSTHRSSRHGRCSLLDRDSDLTDVPTYLSRDTLGEMPSGHPSFFKNSEGDDSRLDLNPPASPRYRSSSRRDRPGSSSHHHHSSRCPSVSEVTSEMGSIRVMESTGPTPSRAEEGSRTEIWKVDKRDGKGAEKVKVRVLKPKEFDRLQKGR